RYLPSPVRLTRIKDLAPHQNVEAVGLRDLLGDPLIEECWCFNFLFDVSFIMEHFDPDIRSLVKLKIIHGFWKNDDQRRIDLLESASHYPNIDLISAYLPDPFGTHHTKMMILFRRDASAQVIIHTANMIPRDWGNMTQAVWQSPLLPLQTDNTSSQKMAQSMNESHPLGSGERFNVDLMRYLDAYGKRLSALMERLGKYDFSSIRAAFIASAPSKQDPNMAKPARRTSFGWLGLKEILSHIPVRTGDGKGKPNIVIQISSIATLGQNPTWLQNFQSDLISTTPTFNIIFPTPTEIRSSLDGYLSGGSIHTKIQSPAQQKQLDYLRPLLCHWRTPSSTSPSPQPRHSNDLEPKKRTAHRGPAAPHIKTYIRFGDKTQHNIDWAMVTSANLSKQAWGDVVSKKGEIWIQSWECGVVVWPELFRGDGCEEDEEAVMIPVFGKDGPGEGKRKVVVGFRMPYDLPLIPYRPDEVPWCASLAHSEPDWAGRTWTG
ncbi:phospholipase D/nuclease, partial [Periconia macrospinosa]